MTTWKTQTIADLGKVITGKTPPSSKPEQFGDEFPFITPSDIQFGNKHTTTERFLSESGIEAHKRIQLPKKTVCVVCIGATIGKICTTEQLSISNQQINSIIVDYKKHDPDFVFYIASLLRNTLEAYASGAATPIVNKNAFSKIKLQVPDLPTQRKIAAILTAYDDLIETNKRRIALLEKMAEELYREWFVRMRFPGYQNTRFVKGVPEGWTIRPIGELCSTVTDGSHFSPPFVEGGKPMASVKDMHAHGFDLVSVKTISDGDFETLKKGDCLPLKNDVLIAKDGSYLKHVFVWGGDFEIVILSSIAILRPNLSEIKPHFFAQVLRQSSTKSMMSGYVSGSALPRIILKDFKKMKLLIPTYDLLDDYEESVATVFQQIGGLLKTNEKLTKTRDLLLPRLISGKLSVENLDIEFPPSMREEAPELEPAYA